MNIKLSKKVKLALIDMLVIIVGAMIILFLSSSVFDSINKGAL